MERKKLAYIHTWLRIVLGMFIQAHFVAILVGCFLEEIFNANNLYAHLIFALPCLLILFIAAFGVYTKNTVLTFVFAIVELFWAVFASILAVTSVALFLAITSTLSFCYAILLYNIGYGIWEFRLENCELATDI